MMHCLCRKSTGKLEYWTGSEWTTNWNLAAWRNNAWEVLEEKSRLRAADTYVVSRPQQDTGTEQSSL